MQLPNARRVRASVGVIKEGYVNRAGRVRGASAIRPIGRRLF